VEHAESGQLPYLKKIESPILATPVPKKRAAPTNTNTTEKKDRRSTRLANKPKSALNMEQQATTLLMRKCGLVDETEVPDQAKEEMFITQFTQPIQDSTVASSRETFGLQSVEGTGCLGAIAIHADA
jgi:hypothetical protein